MSDVATRSIRSREACQLAGVTYRRLDWWTRTGLVSASVQRARGTGTVRYYSQEDVMRLRLIRELSEMGASVQSIRGALDYVEFRGDDWRDCLYAVEHTSTFVFRPEEILDEQGSAVLSWHRAGIGGPFVAPRKLWTSAETRAFRRAATPPP